MEPLNALPKYNLFGLENQDYKKAKVVALPVPYESTVTYKSGTKEGPIAIIEASRNIELYSYELGKDLSDIGIFTSDEIAPDLSSAENMINQISKEAGIVIDDGKIPFLIGGEHTITLGSLKAMKERKKDISIINFDAHTDTRDTIFGSKYTHATVMRRASEMYDGIVQVGTRSIDADSAEMLNKDMLFTVDQLRNADMNEIVDEIAGITKDNIYLSIDLDVLDPSEMPSVGTPEPDGLHFHSVLELIKGLAGRKNLAGLDIVELSPIPYLIAPNFLAAKLAYLTLGYFLAR
ncbi:MAG: agmatinase [Candidatus Micrarchaeia archaeon]